MDFFRNFRNFYICCNLHVPCLIQPSKICPSSLSIPRGLRLQQRHGRTRQQHYWSPCQLDLRCHREFLTHMYANELTHQFVILIMMISYLHDYLINCHPSWPSCSPISEWMTQPSCGNRTIITIWVIDRYLTTRWMGNCTGLIQNFWSELSVIVGNIMYVALIN